MKSSSIEPEVAMRKTVEEVISGLKALRRRYPITQEENEVNAETKAYLKEKLLKAFGFEEEPKLEVKPSYSPKLYEL